jgi:hypothetical protein
MKLFSFLFKLLLIALVRPEYAGLISYSHLVNTKAFDQLVEVDYGDRIYYNESLDIPTIALTRSFTNMEKAKSTIIKGYDMVIKKNVIELGTTFPSQASGDTALTITLSAADKDHLVLGELIRFLFLPTGANYTGFCVVTDKKATTDTTTIIIRPYDYETNTASKIGIASGTNVDAGTKILLMAPRSARGAASVTGIAMFPSTIDNEFQDIRWPYEVDDIAATEKMYIQGTPENLLATQHKGYFNKVREASFLFNGPQWVSPTTILGTTATMNSNMKGLWTSIYGGTSPAKIGYDTWDLVKLDDWCKALDNSRIENKNKTWFVMCNQALITQITLAKRDKPGIMIEGNDTYGIPGVQRVEWGSIKLDLHNHYLFDEIWSNHDKPQAMALTLPLLRYKYKYKEYLRQNIQANDETKKKHEYRIVESYIIHQLNTSYWGLLYANDQRI